MHTLLQRMIHQSAVVHLQAVRHLLGPEANSSIRGLPLGHSRQSQPTPFENLMKIAGFDPGAHYIETYLHAQAQQAMKARISLQV